MMPTLSLPGELFQVIPDLEEALRACQGYWRHYVPWLALGTILGSPQKSKWEWLEGGQYPGPLDKYVGDRVRAMS